MNFTLSEREIKLREAAFLTGKSVNALPFSEKWKIAAQHGLAGLPVDATFQGPGLNAIETAISLEGFSESCTDGGFTFSLAAHLLAGAIPIVKNASGEMKKRILPKVAEGNFILANAMTETGSGSDAFNLKTTAVAQGENFVLNGTKTFCTNAPIANGILVYALTDAAKGFFGGITCFLLEKDKHAYKIGKEIRKNGLHHSPLAEIFLNDVSVNKENVIGKIGAGSMIFLESMNWERACMSAMHVGTMIRVCNRTRDYVTGREVGRGTSSEKLDHFQGVQFRIAEMFLQTELARMLAYTAAKKIDMGEDATESCAKAKIFSSEALNKIAQEAMVLHGANGFMEDYGIGEIIADAQAALIYSGPNDVLRNLIASRL